jgi:asparagine synthase (glutamine-hydrolysing)
MCGFVGAVALQSGKLIDDSVVQQVQRGLDAIGHRGPDDSAIVQNEYYALGHRRLSIIGLGEAGRQPVVGLDSNVLVFNGEIYNYKELAAKYALDTVVDTSSDTQVLFALLKAQGEKVIGEFDGMFAFAFINRHGELLLARDRFGVKPLYYTLENGILRFASELRGLNETPKRLNTPVIHSYLKTGFYPTGEGKTFFTNIFQVEAGETLAFSRGASYPQRGTFSSTSTTSLSGDADKDLMAILERIRSKISVSDVPICFSLSGGVDSSLGLATFASSAAHQKGQMHAISCRPFSAEFSEEALAIHTAKALDVQLHVCSPPQMHSDDEAYEHLQRLTSVIEAPVRSPGVFMQEAVYRHARELGFKVIIDGEGADDLMGAYYGSISSTLTEMARERGNVYAAMQAKRLCQRTGMHWQKLLAKSALQSFHRRTSSGSAANSVSMKTSEIQDLAFHSSLPTLVQWGDRLSMHYSVEARPFYLFQEFLDWSTQLAPSMALSDGYNKWPMRKALASRYGLSDVAYNAKKFGYSTTGETFSSLIRLPLTDSTWRDFLSEAPATLADKKSDFRHLGAYVFFKSYGAI